MQHREIASVAFEAVQMYKKRAGTGLATTWESLPQVAQRQMEALVGKLSRGDIGYANEVHDEWMGNKLRDGWRYGEALDEEAKQSPFMLPFRDLKPAFQAHAVVFFATAMSLLQIVGPPKVQYEHMEQGSRSPHPQRAMSIVQ